MPKTKETKQEILRDLAVKIGKAKSVVFAKFNALGVKESEELRNKLRAENSEYYVAKKTLVSLAFKDQNIENLNAREFEGQVATIFGYGDEVIPAKIVDQFKKEHEEKISFVGGILENKFLSAIDVEKLAKLPSKKELYAKIVGSINAPVSGFVNALAGNLKNLVYALSAIKDKKTN